MRNCPKTLIRLAKLQAGDGWQLTSPLDTRFTVRICDTFLPVTW